MSAPEIVNKVWNYANDYLDDSAAFGQVMSALDILSQQHLLRLHSRVDRS